MTALGRAKMPTVSVKRIAQAGLLPPAVRYLSSNPHADCDRSALLRAAGDKSTVSPRAEWSGKKCHFLGANRMVRGAPLAGL